MEDEWLVSCFNGAARENETLGGPTPLGSPENPIYEKRRVKTFKSEERKKKLEGCKGRKKR